MYKYAQNPVIDAGVHLSGICTELHSYSPAPKAGKVSRQAL